MSPEAWEPSQMELNDKKVAAARAFPDDLVTFASVSEMF
ncbi:hypothetical protein DFR51_2985 [Sphingosinicella microcystinivorans]|jgi:hypothetical protein|uniref:Uncharacterized protein n=1 Tax=Sphingosinicella microcystinivorans TaxID=335406 RepID=A0ABX9SVC0_SPHMI|nr:hypothetical protein DFR51_2985 [Sphingosinicella microcystinivorans]